MKDNHKIIWIASYPKSGNTWFRIFLSNLLADRDNPIHINDLIKTPIASSRNSFDYITGVPSEDLTHREIDILRPKVYIYLSKFANKTLFKKVHDAYTYLADGRPLFPSEASKAVIYIVRNPIDVAISMAHYNGSSYEKMIKVLNDPNYAFCAKTNKLFEQLRQKLGDWSYHVNSWTKQSNIPVLTIRYEDMKNNAYNTFKKAVEFLELDKSKDTIQKAINFSDLSILQEQEKEVEFNENSMHANYFFRKGYIGEGKYIYNKQEINTIINKHKNIMKNFHYINEKNELLV